MSKGAEEKMTTYIKTGKYPKEKSSQIAFYRIYGKIRKFTRLGNKLINLKLMKK